MREITTLTLTNPYSHTTAEHEIAINDTDAAGMASKMTDEELYLVGDHETPGAWVEAVADKLGPDRAGAIILS